MLPYNKKTMIKVDTTKFLKEDYFTMEVLESWIKNHPQKAMKINGKELHQEFKIYCEKNGLNGISKQAFTDNLLNNNEIEYRRFSEGMRYVVPFNTILSLKNKN
jgi:hypothetical protein